MGINTCIMKRNEIKIEIKIHYEEKCLVNFLVLEEVHSWRPSPRETEPMGLRTGALLFLIQLEALCQVDYFPYTVCLLMPEIAICTHRQYTLLVLV